jgi:hypothetical protein
MRSGHTLEGVLCVAGSAGVCQGLAKRLVLLIHLIDGALHKQQDIKVFEQVLQPPQQVRVNLLPQQSSVGHGDMSAQQHPPQLLPTLCELLQRAFHMQFLLRVETAGGNRNNEPGAVL